MKEKSIRFQHLETILYSKYLPAEAINRRFDSKELVDTHFAKELLEVYQNLGGLQEFPMIRFYPRLIEFGRFCVALDESIHFHRYRSKTLRSPFYERLESFPLMKYRTYCRKHEVECLKSGTSANLWSGREAELHFGPSQASGDLGLQGSAGWKLQALKDLMVDMIARHRKIRLLRLSVWDDIMVNRKLKRLNEILMSPQSSEKEMILKLIERRLINLYADDL